MGAYRLFQNSVKYLRSVFSLTEHSSTSLVNTDYDLILFLHERKHKLKEYFYIRIVTFSFHTCFDVLARNNDKWQGPLLILDCYLCLLITLLNGFLVYGVVSTSPSLVVIHSQECHEIG